MAPNKLGYVPSLLSYFSPILGNHVLHPYSGVNQGMWVGGVSGSFGFFITNLCVLSII